MRCYLTSRNDCFLFLFFFIFFFHFLFLFAPFTSYAITQTNDTESKIVSFIRKFYGEKEDIQIRFNNGSHLLKERMKVRRIDFAKMPDANGNGTCTLEVEEKYGRIRNIYISFTVMKKKQIFVLKEALKRGDVINEKDITVKEVLLWDNSNIYPEKIEDVLNKTLKRDMNGGSVLTTGVLENNYIIQRGQIVHIVAENNRLSVQTKGKSLDRGKIGDTIRVKNLTSDREITGRVAGNGVIKVDL
ncbi:MAG: flagellar basal body P-ring formation chaperone FlgA [Syntrophorhabdaceae bacterium]|nr:flagellar basal body P-ring formation chaperone FlgA [Syntrophorhabdaceae bacterium]